MGTTLVPLHKLRGCRLPGKTWEVGGFATRGTPSKNTPGYRAYREFATNDWEDFRVNEDGLVEVEDLSFPFKSEVKPKRFRR